MNQQLHIVTANQRTIEINGITETILSRPVDRNGLVRLTMHGLRENAVEIALDEFERLTGSCFDHLLPDCTFIKNELLVECKAELESLDLTLEKPFGDVLIASGIKFSTEKNIHVSAELYVSEFENSYSVMVNRKTGLSNVRRKLFSGKKSALPILLFNGLEELKRGLTTKVQVLQKGGPGEVTEREFSNEGFAVLAQNESLDDFFHSQDMPAGIVINNAGKYQVFSSYLTFENKRCLDFDSRSYKTLAGAKKFLSGKGFDEKGRYLDQLNEEELYEGARRRLWDYGSTWTKEALLHFSLDQGFGVIYRMDKVNDENTGIQYIIKIEFTDDRTGNSIARNLLLNPQAALDSLIKQVYKFVSDVRTAYESETPEFNGEWTILDPADKSAFHKSRIEAHTTTLKHRLKYRTDDKYSDHRVRQDNEIEAIKAVIKHHEQAVQ